MAGCAVLCLQFVADQTHEEADIMQLRTAAGGDGQVVLPQHVLAEGQQPQEQHVVSHIITCSPHMQKSRYCHTSCMHTRCFWLAPDLTALFKEAI